MEESVADQALFFTSTEHRKNTAYKKAIEAKDYKEEVHALMGPGRYATDVPTSKSIGYAQKLLNTIENYGLKNYGMKESEYVRELITHGGMVDTSLAEDRRNLINQISRTGNNYNQMVRIANGCGYITNSTMQKCNELFAEIKEAFQEVMRRWR